MSEGRTVSQFDVAVVGLGAVGSSALFALAGTGARVIGIDRFNPAHAFGSSPTSARGKLHERHFRFPGNSGLVSDFLRCLLCANSGPCRCLRSARPPRNDISVWQHLAGRNECVLLRSEPVEQCEHSIARRRSRRPSPCTRQLSEVRARSLTVMQLPFAARHAFSDNHPATYEAVLVLVLAKAGLRMPGAKRDKSHGDSC
jgi:hypothetical protein